MLRPMPIEPVPPETARIARAAFPKGNRYLRLADELDTLFTDEETITKWGLRRLLRRLFPGLHARIPLTK
jgi:hypothetical protein